MRLSPVLASAVPLTAGVALGVLAPLLGTVEVPVINALHLVLAAGWAWAALAFGVGFASGSRVRSALLAPCALASAVVAYYVTKLLQGEYQEWVNLEDPSQGTQIHWVGFLSKTLFWGATALILGLLLGLAGNLARKAGPRGLAFRVLIPLVAVTETSLRLSVEASLQGEVAGTTWKVTLLIAVAVLIVLPAHEIRTRSKGDAGHRLD